MSFILDFFLQKVMKKFYEKQNKKKTFWLHLGPFCLFRANKNFYGKPACHFFLFIEFYFCTEFQRKFSKKSWLQTYRWMDTQMHEQT